MQWLDIIVLFLAKLESHFCLPCKRLMDAFQNSLEIVLKTIDDKVRAVSCPRSVNIDIEFFLHFTNSSTKATDNQTDVLGWKMNSNVSCFTVSPNHDNTISPLSSNYKKKIN